MPARTHKASEEFDALNARLINWGRWLQGGMPHLTLKRSDPLPTDYDSEDAQLVEFTMTTWSQTSDRGDMYSFILKLHFAEGWGTPEDMKKDFRGKHNTEVSKAKFYRMLAGAKRSLNILLPEIGTNMKKTTCK